MRIRGPGLPSGLSLGHGEVLRAAAGSVLYLALIALLGLGVAATVRDAAVAMGIVHCCTFSPSSLTWWVMHTGTDTSSRSGR